MNFWDRKRILDKVYNKDENGNETVSIPEVINTDIGGTLMFGNMLVYGEMKNFNSKQNLALRSYNKKYGYEEG